MCRCIYRPIYLIAETTFMFVLYLYIVCHDFIMDRLVHVAGGYELVTTEEWPNEIVKSDS